MDFHKLEKKIREREARDSKKDVAKLADLAEEVTLEDLLHVLSDEIIFSTQPKVLPLDDEASRIRIAILQRPGLRGRYFLEITKQELKFFRTGYDEALSTYVDEKEIGAVYDYIIKTFW